MKIFEFIEGKTLIITENSYKEKILGIMNEKDDLYNVKFMTINEYKKNRLFDYDVKTIHYLVDKYKLKVSNAITLLDNLYYIEDKNYVSDKLRYLKEIKIELDEQGLLIYNEYFKDYLNSVNIIVYEYGKLDKFSNSLFNNAIFVNEDVTSRKHLIHEFNDINMEVEYVFNNISELLIKGISLDKIKLLNVTSEYIPYLKRFSKFYNIPLMEENNCLYGIKMVNDFLSLIKSGASNETIMSFLENYRDDYIYSSLIGILNKYVVFDKIDMVYDLIVNDIKNTKLKGLRYTNILNMITLNTYVNDDDYIFLLGYNSVNIPVTYKDEDYITDIIKSEVIMSDTNELNMLSNYNTIRYLDSINNLTISYKLKTPFKTYFMANLFDDNDIEIVRDTIDSYQYSSLYNRIKYCSMLDNYVKYGEYDKDLGFLYNNYGSLGYRTYDNQYNGLTSNSLLEYLNNKLTLSYSSIDNYYKCGFRYYLTNILKVDLYEETYNTIIGNLFHCVLSKAFLDNFVFENEYNSFINNYSFNSKELFFINKLKKDLLFIIETIKEYQNNTGLTNELYEKRIELVLKKEPLVIYKGFVDKIMFKESNGNTNVAIVDYKTGNPDIKLDYLKYGLSMQLPSYLYLVSHSNMFTNLKINGFYLEHILDNEIKIEKDKTYLEMKKDNLKLMGYSTNDINRLSMLDDSYEDSMMIKGMKVKKDGDIASSSKVLSDDEIDDIINLCEKKVTDALNSILRADFTINPKIIKNDNVGCKYCHFEDICYHQESNNIYIEDDEVEDA